MRMVSHAYCLCDRQRERKEGKKEEKNRKSTSSQKKSSSTYLKNGVNHENKSNVRNTDDHFDHQ
jgi:hypothetical protein